MDHGLIILTILAFLTGIAAGYLSGLLGIGSGVIMVPAAIYLLDLDFREAKAMSLFVIMFTSPLGMWGHHGHGNLHPRTGLILAAPGVCGSLLGVYIAAEMNVYYLKLIFVLVLFFAAYRMIHGTTVNGKKDPSSSSDSDSISKEDAYGARKWFLPVVGFIGGLSAGMLGIGGGIIMVPSMVFLTYPMHSAVANSLMVISLNSFTGTAAHAIRGELDILQAIPMMVGAVISVQKGVDMSVSIDREKLRKYFGYFMILVGIYMLYRSL